jgi:hypothetical protein
VTATQDDAVHAAANLAARLDPPPPPAPVGRRPRDAAVRRQHQEPPMPETPAAQQPTTH